MGETRREGDPLRAVSGSLQARPNRTWTRGRTCEHDGCPTVLSIYNRSASCSVHEEVRVYIQRGKRRSSRTRTTGARVTRSALHG